MEAQIEITHLGLFCYRYIVKFRDGSSLEGTAWNSRKAYRRAQEMRAAFLDQWWTNDEVQKALTEGFNADIQRGSVADHSSQRPGGRPTSVPRQMGSAKSPEPLFPEFQQEITKGNTVGPERRAGP